MKRVLYNSFLIASFAIHASAITPTKMPAVHIDTLYVLSGKLVLEYEVIQPFDHVSFSVGSNWDQTIKGVNPVLLSGNPGKDKISVPVNLIIDQVTHFNVSLTGLQFINKGDSAYYQSVSYRYALFKKQSYLAILTKLWKYRSKHLIQSMSHQGQ